MHIAFTVYCVYCIGPQGHGEVRHEQGELRQDEAHREDDRPPGHTQLNHTQGRTTHHWGGGGTKYCIVLN